MSRYHIPEGHEFNTEFGKSLFSLVFPDSKSIFINYTKSLKTNSDILEKFKIAYNQIVMSNDNKDKVTIDWFNESKMQFTKGHGANEVKFSKTSKDGDVNIMNLGSVIADIIHSNKELRYEIDKDDIYYDLLTVVAGVKILGEKIEGFNKKIEFFRSYLIQSDPKFSKANAAAMHQQMVDLKKEITEFQENPEQYFSEQRKKCK